MAPRPRPQLDKLANGKPKPMSRTSGVAKRTLGASESIGFKLKAGMPLTGSASGVKSITTKQAGEVLTQGIVTLAKNGLQMDPVSLAGFMPFGKALNVAKRLTEVGQMSKAAAILARSRIAERGRSSAGRIIASARYVDDIASDALGARDFGAATGQARRYYQDALSQIRAGQKSRVNPALGNFFPKIGPSLKVTMKSIRGLDPVSPVAKRAVKAPTSFIVKKK